jgi:hypothetical protein
MLLSLGGVVLGLLGAAAATTVLSIRGSSRPRSARPSRVVAIGSLAPARSASLLDPLEVLRAEEG